MAMTPAQINADLAKAFRCYASKQRRAGLVLGNRLAVLRQEAALAHLNPRDFEQMARAQMDITDARMRSDVATFHPVAAIAGETS